MHAFCSAVIFGLTASWIFGQSHSVNGNSCGQGRGASVVNIEFQSDLAGLDVFPFGETRERPTAFFRISKRVFDLLLGVLLLPVMLSIAMLLFLVNPIFNKGSIFFVQTRMGMNCQPFRMFKFRTMHRADSVTRSAECPLETSRITRFGRFLRETRIDELPQVLNVLRGEMSFIGPRPDCYDYAIHYINEVDGYRDRHSVRPGISGLAQTAVGYTEGIEATRRKVNADLYYISKSGFRLEAWIFIHTFTVILGRAGS